MIDEKISLIVPCYNEEESLPYFYEEFSKLSRQLSFYKFEVIFINDGSKDHTLQILKEFAAQDNRIKYISFSKKLWKRGSNLRWL